MQTTEEFEDERRYVKNMLRDYGGEFDLTQLPKETPLVHTLNDRANQMCERIVEQDFYEKTPIHFRFLNNYEINAIAACNIVPIVGINIGVPFALLETFARVMCSKRVFPRVGNRSLENRGHEPYKLPVRAEFDLSRWDFPRCTIRATFGNFLARTAFDFLMGHEIGHIGRGHLLLPEGQHRNVIMERDHSPCTDNLTSQALELDADIHGVLQAAHGAFNTMRALRAGYAFQSPDQKLAAIAGTSTPERAIESTVFAIWVVFKLFQENRDIPLDQLSHPPLLIRVSGMVGALVQTASKNPAYELCFEAAQNAAYRAISSAEKVVAEITCNQQPLYEVDELLVARHYTSLVQRGDELEPILRDVQRGRYERNSAT